MKHNQYSNRMQMPSSWTKVNEAMRYHHYAYRREQTCGDWILRYLKFHGSKTHPREMGKTEIERFLSNLAVRRNIAASTQRRTMKALPFLYRRVLQIPVGKEVAPSKAGRQRKLPVVMTQAEVGRVPAQMHAPLYRKRTTPERA